MKAPGNRWLCCGIWSYLHTPPFLRSWLFLFFIWGEYQVGGQYGALLGGPGTYHWLHADEAPKWS